MPRNAEGLHPTTQTTFQPHVLPVPKVVFLRKKTLRNIGVLNDRDHRKPVVIDGREAFVGGHCIVDAWLGDAEDN
jgi:phosphatidylserine/phosphatidylglycerophosphate/cardiolipin synthase-like enzyme